MLRDRSSLSNPDEVKITQLDWDVRVDFENESLIGSAVYAISILKSNVRTMVLDTSSSLEIDSVQDQDGNQLSYSLGGCWSLRRRKAHLGCPLTIQLPTSSNTCKTGTGTGASTGTTSTSTSTVSSVKIMYRTLPTSTAIQWLPPAQTAGKVHPYLYTQCQAIHARALLPCQDQPGVKCPYRSTVTVPTWATAVVSGLLRHTNNNNNNKQPDDGDSTASTPNGNHNTHPTTRTNNNDSTNNGDGTHTFAFEQTVPVPSYLIALAVGDLERRVISPRCAVWSEPSIVAAVAWEFAQTEDFLSAAESLAGMPYGWGRYDLLCLPPSSPYGGMENPTLTFCTPTLLAGDRSLADVVAHEIAHSWTGNCVTNATWDHFWLNEGWTTWFQRKIMGRIYDDELLVKTNDDDGGDSKTMFIRGDHFIGLDALGGHETLVETVREIPLAYTSLVLDIGDGDPDDAYSSVAYEKGFQLLYAIEQKVGKLRMEQFFQAYLQTFSFQTLTSDDFLTFCTQYFSEVPAIQNMDWNTWLHGTGMPPEEAQFDTTLAVASTNLADAWLQLDGRHPRGAEVTTANDDGNNNNDGKSVELVPSLNDWTCLQITYFLDALTSATTTATTTSTNGGGCQPLSPRTCQQMDDMYEFSKSKNAEILFRYCRLALAAGSCEEQGIYPIVIQFITSQGRMKFTRPLYRALYLQNPQLARETFLKHRMCYHPICAKMVAADLLLPSSSSSSSGSARSSPQSGSLSTARSVGKWLLAGSAVVAGAAIVLSRQQKR